MEDLIRMLQLQERPARAVSHAASPRRSSVPVSPDRALQHLGNWLPKTAFHRFESAYHFNRTQGELPTFGALTKAQCEAVLEEGSALLMEAVVKRDYPAQNWFSAVIPLLSWRLTKGMYEFDPALLEALRDTDDLPLPLDVFSRMPEHCVYVPLGGRRFLGHAEVEGMFLMVSTVVDDVELHVTALLSDGNVATNVMALHAGKTLRECNLLTQEKSMAAYAALSASAPELAKMQRPPTLEHTEAQVSDMVFAANVLLYLCSKEPDLTGVVRAPEVRYKGRRWRLDIPQRPNLLQVGFRYGGAVRMWKEQQWGKRASDTSGTGMPKSPHVRRAHFHLYWTGPGRMVPVVHWIPPTLVGLRADQMSEFPVTVRPVLDDPANAQ